MLSKITEPQQFYIVLPFFIHWKFHTDHSESELVKQFTLDTTSLEMATTPQMFSNNLEFLQKLLVAKKNMVIFNASFFHRGYEAMPNFFAGPKCLICFFVFRGKYVQRLPNSHRTAKKSETLKEKQDFHQG